MLPTIVKKLQKNTILRSIVCDKGKYTTLYNSFDEEEFEDDKQCQLELHQEEAREQMYKYKKVNSYKSLSNYRTANYKLG